MDNPICKSKKFLGLTLNDGHCWHFLERKTIPDRKHNGLSTIQMDFFECCRCGSLDQRLAPDYNGAYAQ